jgi:long-chain acyl-CoA synthetase
LLELVKKKTVEKIGLEVIERLLKSTLPQILAEHAQRFGENGIAIREKAYGIWQCYTWTDYYHYVKLTALGLLSLKIERGDSVGIIMNNHPEWLFSEIGAQAVGAITLNLFTSAIAEELAASLSRTQAAFVIVQDQEQVDKLLEKKDSLSHIKKVIYIDPTGMRTYQDDPWLMSFRDLLKLGEAMHAAEPDRFMQELEKGKPRDTALMLQTSGTTGIPKLAMLTHRNFTSMAKNWLEAAPVGIGTNWLSISPPAWFVDQMWGVGVTLTGAMTMNFPETPDTVVEDFREIGPEIIIASSRFWEDLASRIRVKMSNAGIIRNKFFSLANRVGNAKVDYEIRKKKVPLLLEVANVIAFRLVFAPLLDRVGCSRFLAAFTGGHPISPDVIRFFRATGLNLKQCYGLTEAGGIFQIQPDGEVKMETVGKPLPGTQVRISKDEEVLVFSEANFSGYYRDYEATAAAFEEGWLRTGDAGYIDDDGHLLIIGRKEEIIRNKAGAAFSPDFIETRLKFSPFIKESVIFGEGRPFITAMINIDMGNVGSWAEERMIPYTTYTDLSQQTQVEELICAEITKVNRELPDHMKIRRFILLYKLLDADDEELTRTGKVRRRFVYGLYIKLIEAMYGKERTVAVQGKIRYRDGQIGKIETTVRILEANRE